MGAMMTDEDDTFRVRHMSRTHRLWAAWGGVAVIVTVTAAIISGIFNQPDIPEPEPIVFPSGSVVIPLPTDPGQIVGLCDGPNRIYVNSAGIEEIVKDSPPCPKV